MYIEFYAEFKKLWIKKVLNRSANHFIKIKMLWVRSLILWSDLHFYWGPSFFADFWFQYKILYTKIHFLGPTTKFCLRVKISEPCSVNLRSFMWFLILDTAVDVFQNGQPKIHVKKEVLENHKSSHRTTVNVERRSDYSTSVNTGKCDNARHG